MQTKDLLYTREVLSSDRPFQIDSTRDKWEKTNSNILLDLCHGHANKEKLVSLTG